MKKMSTFLEVLGGSRPIGLARAERPLTWILLGVWWAALLMLALAFVGRATKFIYVDF
jgi:hypothetical protein